MKKTELKRFRAVLEEKRDAVIRRARETMDQDMTLDASELPDEMDLASSEYMQSFTFRLRGRERVFLQKIEKAIKDLHSYELPEILAFDIKQGEEGFLHWIYACSSGAAESQEADREEG